MMWFLIPFLISCIVAWKIGHNGFMYVGFFLGIYIGVLSVSIKQQNKFDSCIDKEEFLKPSIIHVSDNSSKIVRWKDHEEIIKNDNPMFYTPESLVVVEPCAGKIIIKK